VMAGHADNEPPRILQIPRNLQVVRGEPLRVTAIVVDQRTPDTVSATLHYRPLSKGRWKALPMKRNALARDYAFFADIPGRDTTTTIEYYISATDGDNTSVAPSGAPDLTASALVKPATGGVPGTVKRLRSTWDGDAGGVMLTWKPAGSQVHQYTIYRSTTPTFTPSRTTYVTYVPSDQLFFLDVNVEPGTTYYYQIEAESISGRTGHPASTSGITVPEKSPPS